MKTWPLAGRSTGAYCCPENTLWRKGTPSIQKNSAKRLSSFRRTPYSARRSWAGSADSPMCVRPILWYETPSCLNWPAADISSAWICRRPPVTGWSLCPLLRPEKVNLCWSGSKTQLFCHSPSTIKIPYWSKGVCFRTFISLSSLISPTISKIILLTSSSIFFRIHV